MSWYKSGSFLLAPTGPMAFEHMGFLSLLIWRAAAFTGTPPNTGSVKEQYIRVWIVYSVEPVIPGWKTSKPKPPGCLAQTVAHRRPASIVSSTFRKLDSSRGLPIYSKHFLYSQCRNEICYYISLFYSCSSVSPLLLQKYEENSDFFFSEVELQGGFTFKLSLGNAFPRASHRLSQSGVFILATSRVWLHLNFCSYILYKDPR